MGEMFLVQRGNKGGAPLLRAGTEYVVVRIWGKVVLVTSEPPHFLERDNGA